jgi:hypothetical protein
MMADGATARRAPTGAPYKATRCGFVLEPTPTLCVVYKVLSNGASAIELQLTTDSTRVRKFKLLKYLQRYLAAFFG